MHLARAAKLLTAPAAPLGGKNPNLLQAGRQEVTPKRRKKEEKRKKFVSPPIFLEGWLETQNLHQILCSTMRIELFSPG